MKKSFILITLIAVLTASVALACAAGNLDCPYTGPTEWGIVSICTESYACPTHVNCTVTEHWALYGWKCPVKTCGYGQGEPPAVLLNTSHAAPLR